LIYAIEHIDDGVQTGRHIADGSIFFCKRKNDDEQTNGTDLYLLNFSLEPVLLAVKHGHHHTWACFTAAGAIIQQIPEKASHVDAETAVPRSVALRWRAFLCTANPYPRTSQPYNQEPSIQRSYWPPDYTPWPSPWSTCPSFL
jgi:hypothetical protein